MKKSIRIIFSMLFFGNVAYTQIPVSNQFVTAEIPQWPVIVNPGEYVSNQLLVMLNPDVVIGDLEKQFSEKGFTIIPVKMYITERGFAKLEIGLAKGKKLYDKREDLKKKDAKREMDREGKGR